MKKHVIALGRQFGSGGREIGRKLSESLGFASSATSTFFSSSSSPGTDTKISDFR